MSSSSRSTDNNSASQGSRSLSRSVTSKSSSRSYDSSILGQLMAFPPPRHSSNSDYVSPYPPVPRTGSSSAATPITATAGSRAASTQALAALLASTSSSSGSKEETVLAQKQALIDALNEHRINTVGELRRVERIFATLGSSDLTQPMTAAWVYYVNSNSLLTELRSLTRNYPFSSECLDEAKRRVYQDPASNRSWNYCWLVLAKVHTDGLIPTFARAQASRPEMWGGRTPSAESVNKLVAAFMQEWTSALAQLLRYWESPPVR